MPKAARKEFVLISRNIFHDLQIAIDFTIFSPQVYFLIYQHRDRTLDWNRCIVIHMNNYIDPDVVKDPDWPEYWDLCLNQTLTASPNWNVEAYEAEDHNCFAFVLAFLRSLKQEPLSSHANNKLEFCTKYVLPKTTIAGKYICLFRKIREHKGLYAASVKK